MKVKLAFIGNSSSASYYVRQVPQPPQATPNGLRPGQLSNDGESSVYWLDRWYKWSKSTKWGQQAIATVNYVGNIGDLDGFSFKAGMVTTSGVVASNYTESTFPTGTTDPTDGTVTYTIAFGSGGIPANSESFTVVLASNISGLTGVANITSSVANIARLNYGGLLTGEWSVCFSWDKDAQIITIYAQHKTICEKTSSCAAIIKDLAMTTA